MFSNLSPNSFPCKFHYLVHYHRLLDEFGPLRNLWCMRFEAKHQYFKRFAAMMRNFRNVALSLATRHQYLQCLEFSVDSFLQEEGTLNDCTQVSGRNLPRLLQRTLNDIIIVQDDLELSKSSSVTLESMTYSENDVIVLDIVHAEDIPIFGKVKYLLRHDTVWYVCTKVYRTVQFRRHLHAYEVHGADGWHVFKACQKSDFQCLDVYELDGKCLISMKYKVCKI